MPKKRKTVFVYFALVLLSACMSFSGKAEIPPSYTDLGAISTIGTKKPRIPNNRIDVKIKLPYDKPEGINMIGKEGTDRIIIHSLIADGKRIKPKLSLFREKYFFDKVHGEFVDLSCGHYTIDMELGILHESEKYKPGVIYYSVTREDGRPETYYIPYGAKEIYLVYDIIFKYFPEGGDGVVRIKSDERYAVKWEFEWF